MILPQNRPDSHHYWEQFWLCRKRASHIGDIWNNFPNPLDQRTVETFLFHFRMFLENFCLMGRYRIVDHADLSKGQKKAYTPNRILNLEGLEKVRLVGLKEFVLSHDSTSDEFAPTFVYDEHFEFDVIALQQLHGRLGAALHVMPEFQVEKRFPELLGGCYAIFRKLSPLLTRHLFEYREGNGMSDADISGLRLVIGADDLGRDWFIECERTTWNVRMRPDF